MAPLKRPKPIIHTVFAGHLYGDRLVVRGKRVRKWFQGVQTENFVDKDARMFANIGDRLYIGCASYDPSPDQYCGAEIVEVLGDGASYRVKALRGRPLPTCRRVEVCRLRKDV